MASVPIDFLPPTQPDITKLHIQEAPDATGPWTDIETVTAVGTYPGYISRYTTDDAASSTDWFRIRWEDSKGALSDWSEPRQGGTENYVSVVISDILLRDPSLNENVVAQEVMAAIQRLFGVADPLSLPSDYGTLSQRLGLTYLIQGRSTVLSAISGGSSESYTAGLVSQKSDSGSTASEKLLRWLSDEANRLLGITNAYVMMLEDIDPTGIGSFSSFSWDHTRLAVTINYE